MSKPVKRRTTSPGHNRSSRRMDITIDGMTLVVRTHVSTGTDPKTRPGVGLSVLWHGEEPAQLRRQNEDGTVYWDLLGGVVDRDRIRALRNLLTEFVLDFPEDAPE